MWDSQEPRGVGTPRNPSYPLPNRALGLGTSLVDVCNSPRVWDELIAHGHTGPMDPTLPSVIQGAPGQGDWGPQHARYFDHRGGGLKEARLKGSGYTHAPTDS